MNNADARLAAVVAVEWGWAEAPPAYLYLQALLTTPPPLGGLPRLVVNPGWAVMPYV